MRRDISIRIVALYELDNWGSIPFTIKSYLKQLNGPFGLLRNKNGGVFSLGQQLQLTTTYLPSSCADVKRQVLNCNSTSHRSLSLCTGDIPFYRHLRLFSPVTYSFRFYNKISLYIFSAGFLAMCTALDSSVDVVSVQTARLSDVRIPAVARVFFSLFPKRPESI